MRWRTAALALLWGLYGLSAGLVLFLVWNRLRLDSMDLAGHLAGGVAFGRGLFHRFNDQFFLGTIQNLFYPPLEDALMAGLQWVTRDPIRGFRVYLSLLVLGYLAAILALAARLVSLRARVYFLGVMLFFLCTTKPGLQMYQGLSFEDLWISGLSSEFLGGIFWLLLLRELLGPSPRVFTLALLSSLAVVSHLIIAIVVVVTLCLAGWTRHRSAAWRGLALGLSLSAFFWVPFVAHREFIISGNIFLGFPFEFMVLGLGLLWFSLRAPAIRFVNLAALLLIVPLVVGPFVIETRWALPPFHYYRFAVCGLILLMLCVALVLDQDPGRPLRPSVVTLSMVLVVFCGTQFRLRSYADVTADRERPIPTREIAGPVLEEYGRTWIIDRERVGGFGIDALLAVDSPEFRGTKGLNWEAARGNRLLASYFASLLTPGGVIDHFGLHDSDCDVQRCVFQHFARSFNVQRVLRTEPSLAYLSDEENQCLDLIVADPIVESRAIEAVVPTQLEPLTGDRMTHAEQVIRTVYEACLRGEVSGARFLPAENLAALSLVLPAERPLDDAVVPKLVPHGVGEFVISSPSTYARPLWIKLAYLPGAALIDRTTGSSLPLYEAASGMIAVGRGEMLLRYQRTSAMWAGYLVTLASLLGACFVWLASRRRVARAP